MPLGIVTDVATLMVELLAMAPTMATTRSTLTSLRAAAIAATGLVSVSPVTTSIGSPASVSWAAARVTPLLIGPPNSLSAPVKVISEPTRIFSIV